MKYTEEALNNTAKALTDKGIYDQEWLESTLISLEADLEDLDIWSVYNLDKYNEEIYTIKQALQAIKESL